MKVIAQIIHKQPMRKRTAKSHVESGRGSKYGQQSSDQEDLVHGHTQGACASSC